MLDTCERCGYDGITKGEDMRNRSSKTFQNAATKEMTTVQVVLEDGLYRVEICHQPGNSWGVVECADRANALEVSTRLCRDAIARGRTEVVKWRSVSTYA